MTLRPGIQGILQRLGLAWVNLWESPWGALLLAGMVYFLISARYGSLFHASGFNYYNYIADAFLHGSLKLRLVPSSTLDLSYFNGGYYGYWAPFPAFVLMPFILLFGVQFNDVLFTAAVAAINVGLVAWLLRRACLVGFLHLSKSQRSILVMFFALGTVYITLAPFGIAGHTAQIVGVTCMVLAYLVVFLFRGSTAWLLAGLALSAAFLSRSSMVFTGIFPFIYLFHQEKSWSWPKATRYALLAVVPMALTLAFYFYYNWARFGSIFETGLSYHLMNEFFRANFVKYGLFNIHYVLTNLYFQLVVYPFPVRDISHMGGSLFLLSPLFFGAFAAFWKPRLPWANWALLASILVTEIPILLFFSTGWVEFGPRYTLDFAMPLLLLTALGIERWKPSLAFILAAASILQYFAGAPLW